MSTFTVLLLCIQACFVQNVYSQCLGTYGTTGLSPATSYGYGAGVAELAYPATGYAGAYPSAGYAGAYPSSGYASGYPVADYAGAYSAYGYGAGISQYGGAGEGNVAVAGELPVAGNTAVAGQVPIMGAVRFDGAVPAYGNVAINGNCACGCGAPYFY